MQFNPNTGVGDTCEAQLDVMGGTTTTFVLSAASPEVGIRTHGMSAHVAWVVIIASP